MKDCKTAGRYAMSAVKEELKKANIYVFLLVIFLILQYCFSGVQEYLRQAEESMNLFELYIAFLSTRNSQIIYLVGVLILTCGNVFFSSGSPYYLIRSSKKIWITGQIMYMTLLSVSYNIFLFVCLVISCGGHVTVSDEWSNAAMMACQFSAETIGIRPIVTFSYNILRHSPTLAGMITFLFSVLIGINTGIIMTYFQIRRKTIYGTAVILLLWYFDVLIENMDGFSGLGYLSLYGLSRIYGSSWGSGSYSLWYAFCFLFCVMLVLIFIELNNADKIDFMKLE